MERFVAVAAVLCVFIGSSFGTSLSAAQDGIWQANHFVRSRTHRDIPPVTSGPVNVSLGLSLTGIREVDTRKNELEIIAMLPQQWSDPAAVWRNVIGGSTTTNTSSIVIEKDQIWTPDITAYNAVTAPEVLSPERVLVNENGTIVYVPLMRIRFQCYLGNVNTERGSVCVLRLGPWTEDADVVTVDAQGVTLNSFEGEPEYELVEATSARYLVDFPCCEGFYSQARFSFNIRKRERGIGALFNF